jgi:hypothetical protein
MYEPFLGIPAVGECPIYIFPALLWAFICSAWLAIQLSGALGPDRPLKHRAAAAWVASILLLSLASHVAFRMPPRYPILGWILIIVGAVLAAYVGVRVSGVQTRERFAGASAVILAELVVVFLMGHGAQARYEQISAMRCVQNLKMIGSAMGEYRDRHSGGFAPSKGWQQSITPYLPKYPHVVVRPFECCFVDGVAYLRHQAFNGQRPEYVYHRPSGPAVPGSFALVTCDHPAGVFHDPERIILQANGQVRCDRVIHPNGR